MRTYAGAVIVIAYADYAQCLRSVFQQFDLHGYRLTLLGRFNCFFFTFGLGRAGIVFFSDAVYVNGTGSIDNLVALLFQIGEELNIVVIEFLIRAEDLQAGSQRHGRNILELDESGVSE